MTSAVAYMLIIIGRGEINWEVDFFWQVLKALFDSFDLNGAINAVAVALYGLQNLYIVLENALKVI